MAEAESNRWPHNEAKHYFRGLPATIAQKHKPIGCQMDTPGTRLTS